MRQIYRKLHTSTTYMKVNCSARKFLGKQFHQEICQVLPDARFYDKSRLIIATSTSDVLNCICVGLRVRIRTVNSERICDRHANGTGAGKWRSELAWKKANTKALVTYCDWLGCFILLILTTVSGSYWLDTGGASSEVPKSSTNATAVDPFALRACIPMNCSAGGA